MAVNIDMSQPVSSWVPQMTDLQLDDFIKNTQALMFDASTKLAIAQAIQQARRTGN